MFILFLYLTELCLKNGIFRRELYFPTKVRVFVHNYGVLRTIRAGRSNFRGVAVNTRHIINVEHDIYKMLDFDTTLRLYFLLVIF